MRRLSSTHTLDASSTQARAPEPVTTLGSFAGFRPTLQLAVVRSAAAIAGIVGAVVLAGWVGDIPSLKSVLPGYASMKPNTALSFLLAAAALWVATTPHIGIRYPLAARSPALVAAAIAGLTLIEYGTGLDLHTDQLLLADQDPMSMPYPGRMSIPAALSFLMFGIAMTLPRRSAPSINLAFGALYTVPLLCVSLALVGFAYGIPWLYRPLPSAAIAIHTAATLLVVLIGAAATRPDVGLVALVTSPGAGGIIARRLLPAVIVLPLILGWLALQGHATDRFDLATTIAVLALGSVAALSAVVWGTCNEVDRHDVERQQAATALRITEAMFMDFAQNAPMAMYMKDLQGAYRFHNREGERVYKFSDSELRGRTARDFHTQREAAEIEALERKVVETGRPVVSERHNSGVTEYEWVEVTKFPIRDDAGRLVAIGGFDIDISQERRSAAALLASEESLRTSEARYRNVVELIHDAIWIHKDGNIQFANPAAARLFGVESPAQLVGKSIFSLLHTDDRALAEERTRILMRDRQPLPSAELRVGALDGTAKVVEIHPTSFEQDGNVYVLSAGRDITEQRTAESQLRQTQKMEAVGNLTGGIAHDFNNLLLVIMGSIEAALDLPPEKTRGMLSNALSASQRGAALVQKLLAFSRRQALRPEGVNINRLTSEMVDLLRRTLGGGIEIDLRLLEDLWTTFTDRSQLENALLNLAINARDAMAGSGKLTIETANIHLDQTNILQNSDIAPGDYVMLAVTDTGTGMTPDVLERAMEPFFTTKGAGKGSGLGLSMIYGFAKQSRGYVKIYSEAGHGTTVRLYLPRHRASAAHDPTPQPVGAATGEDPRGHEIILVVEDDAEVMKLVSSQMESLGYRVITAANGPQALEILNADHSLNLLFTDIVMPGGMNGRQLAEAARKIRPGLKVLYTSGYTRNAIVHQGRLDQGVKYLAKPYRRSDLARKLRQVLDASA
jgi:PAS domain S-box-containing protein